MLFRINKKILFFLGIFGLIHFLNNAAVIKTYSKPGVYRIREDLTNSGTDAVIEIDADNVVLDLGGYVLSHSGTGSIIRVLTGHTDITIKNGTLDGFGNNTDIDGIYVIGTQSMIYIEDMKIINCGSNAIYFDTTLKTDCFVRNCQIINCLANTDWQTAIALRRVERFIVSDIWISDCGSASYGIHPFYITNSNDGVIKNVVINNLKGNYSYIFYLTSSNASTPISGLHFVNCSVKNSTVGNGFAFFLRTVGASGAGEICGNVFEDCQVTQMTTTGIFCYGLNLSEGLDGKIYNNIFKNFSFMDNSGSDIKAINMVSPASQMIKNIFIDFLITRNYTTGTMSGLYVNGASQSLFMDNTISFNGITGAGTVVKGVDFLAATGGNYWEFADCDVVQNNGSTDANSYGIWETGTDNILIENNVIQNGALSQNQISNGVDTPIVIEQGNKNLVSA